MSSLYSFNDVVFALFTYNHGLYVKESLLSILAQDCPPFEVIIYDDCSSDDTITQIKNVTDFYKGQHKIQLIISDKNNGLIANINRHYKNIPSKIIVAGSGDDVFDKQRVCQIVQAFNTSSQVKMVCSSAAIIDEKGVFLRYESWGKSGLYDASFFSSQRNSQLGATQAWHRDIFDVFFDLPENCIFEDALTGFRAALLGEIYYIPTPLVRWRTHTNNVCNQKILFKNRNNLVVRRIKILEWWCITKKSQIADLKKARDLLEINQFLDLECKLNLCLINTESQWEFERKLFHGSRLINLGVILKKMMNGDLNVNSFLRLCVTYCLPPVFYFSLVKILKFKLSASH